MNPWPVLGLKEWLWVSAGQTSACSMPVIPAKSAELVEQLGRRLTG